MITIKCKCGSTEMTFESLSQKDFPNGWFTDCCQEALDKAPKIEVQESVSDELVEMQFESLEKTMAALPTTNELPELTSEDLKKIGEEVASGVEMKRRGRKR